MAISETAFNFPNQTARYQGKVRDVYSIGDDIIVSVATDRISAFDVVLPCPIPFKGQVLNQLASHFLHASSDIVPTWLLSTPDPNVSIGKRAEPFAIEMIVRSSLVGTAWRSYLAGSRTICGVVLPDGLQEYDQFDTPIITPTTKADEGHDADTSAKEIIANKLATKEQFVQLSDYAVKLFALGQSMANERGLILADTKYEFGLLNDQIILIDEIHTPDSSRYFYKDSYLGFLQDRSTEPPRHLSKEFVRQWLIENDFMGQDGQNIPDMTDAVVQSISDRYIELYEQLTGTTFQPADTTNEIERIETNVLTALQDL